METRSLEIGICSFSFHRLLAAGKQDIFRYIEDCRALGCTQLDPWNAHLSEIRSGDDVLHAGRNPQDSGHLTTTEASLVERVRAAADAAGLPVGLIAIDGAHIYDPNPEVRAANRARAYRWLEVSGRLGARQVRIDSGGQETLVEEEFAIICDGYADLIERAKAYGIEVLIENHWGPSVIPAQLVRILEAVPGLGLLYDSHNFKPEFKAEGRRLCAPYARATHFKTFAFGPDGEESTGERPEEAIDALLAAGYAGAWGVESVPQDGDEIEGARATIALIRRRVAGAVAA